MTSGATRSRVSARLVGLAVVTGLLLGAAGPAAADWTSIGPYGGSVSALAIDPRTPTTLYAGTSAGVYKSTNGGTSWSAANAGLMCGDALCSVGHLALDPQTPTTLYAGTGAGVFKSTDSGASWSRGQLFDSVTSLALDPQTPTTLYAGAASGCGKFGCAFSAY